MTDWPTGLEDTNELLIALNKEIAGDLRKERLQKYSNDLCKNLGKSGNAWKVEATESLLELFTFYPDKNKLDEVLNEFIANVKKQAGKK